MQSLLASTLSKYEYYGSGSWLLVHTGKVFLVEIVFLQQKNSNVARLCHYTVLQPNHGVCGAVVVAGLVYLY